MTIFWLILWLLSDTPTLQLSPTINGWTIFLIISLIMDISSK